MIKKTFDTLKKSPSIFIGIAIPIVLVVLAMIPLVASVNGIMNIAIDSTHGSPQLADADIVQHLGGYFLSTFLILTIGLASGFLVLPPVFNKIYETCSGIDEPDWISRGLKRSWWKVVVTGLIISAAAIIIVIFSLIAILIPILGTIAYVATMLTFYVFAIIALTATIAEDDFGKGLGSIFTVGSKYFFKMLGTYLITLIPPMLFSIGLWAFMMISVFSASAYDNPDIFMSQIFSNYLILLWITLTLVYVYYIFAVPFLYTYSMHQYLANRQLQASPASTEKADISRNTNQPEANTD